MAIKFPLENIYIHVCFEVTKNEANLVWEEEWGEGVLERESGEEESGCGEGIRGGKWAPGGDPEETHLPPETFRGGQERRAPSQEESVCLSSSESTLNIQQRGGIILH